MRYCKQISTVASLFLVPTLLLAEANSVVHISEIAVTGEKVERTLQETTTAVSVIHGNTIDSAQEPSIYDVSTLVPNMINNPSEIPVIRGVSGAGASTGVFTFISGARPRISTSVDGISESWSGQRYLDMGSWDVEQIEVLRGPQSTAQGRNSIGGAVVVQTKDPTFDWEGAVRVGYENNDDKASLAAMLSGPIIENELAMRIAAQGLQGHNFINYQGEYPWDPSEIKQGSIRGKLLWIPRDIEGLIAKVTLSHRVQEGAYLNEVEEPNFSDRIFRQLTSETRRTDSKNTTLSTEVEYAITDDLKWHVLVGHSSYNATFEDSSSDRFHLDLDEKSTTLETRLVHDPKGGILSSMVGFYFYNRTQDLLAEPDGFEGTDDINTLALFGEETLHVNSKLDLIFGGRLEREHQERDVVAWPGTAWVGYVTTDEAQSIFLPKVGLNYKLTPEHHLGFTVRKGYSPGGGAVDWYTSEFYEFDKEEVITYEFTTRSSMIDKALTLNTNLFYNDYEDYQGLLNRRFVNIPKGESYGFETEAMYRIDPLLEVHGGIGLLRSKITEADALNPATQGNEFNYAPHFTGNIGFEKHLASGFFFGSDLNYIGEYYSDIENNEANTAGKYTLLNLHAGYATKSYTIRTYMKNALDEDVIYYKTSNYAGASAKVGQPRTVGITFDYRF